MTEIQTLEQKQGSGQVFTSKFELSGRAASMCSLTACQPIPWEAIWFRDEPPTQDHRHSPYPKQLDSLQMVIMEQDTDLCSCGKGGCVRNPLVKLDSLTVTGERNGVRLGLRQNMQHSEFLTTTQYLVGKSSMKQQITLGNFRTL